MLAQWARDVETFGYADTTNRGSHRLTCIEVTPRKYEWIFDVYGVLFDRVATEWRLNRPSGIHEKQWYYEAFLNGKRLRPEHLLTMNQIDKLWHASRDGYDRYAMAALIRSL